MIKCCSLKNALFHNSVHILVCLSPIIAGLVYFSCVKELKGIIIFAVALFLALCCCFPIIKCSFLIICDLVKRQTVIKNSCEVRQAKVCYIPSGFFGRRMFVTDLRPDFINKLDFCLNETIGNGFSDKDYLKVRLYLHEKDFSKTVLYKYLDYEFLCKDISVTLTSYKKPALHLAIDVEYYRFSKLIKSFNVYEKRVYIPEKNKINNQIKEDL